MKLKMNILDFIIIFIVIAVLCVSGFLFTKINKTTVSKGVPVTLEFTVEVKNLSQEAAQSFKNAVGNQVVYGTKNSDTGVITNVEIEPCKRVGKDLINGTAFWDIIPNEYQAMVTIKTDIYENEKFFVGEAEEVRVGIKMPFSGGGIASPDGVILNVEKLGGGLNDN